MVVHFKSEPSSPDKKIFFNIKEIKKTKINTDIEEENPTFCICRITSVVIELTP